MCWGGEKVLSSFSMTSYRRTQMNFLANPVASLVVNAKEKTENSIRAERERESESECVCVCVYVCVCAFTHRGWWQGDLTEDIPGGCGMSHDCLRDQHCQQKE